MCVCLCACVPVIRPCVQELLWRQQEREAEENDLMQDEDKLAHAMRPIWYARGGMETHDANRFPWRRDPHTPSGIPACYHLLHPRVSTTHNCVLPLHATTAGIWHTLECRPRSDHLPFASCRRSCLSLKRTGTNGSRSTRKRGRTCPGAPTANQRWRRYACPTYFPLPCDKRCHTILKSSVLAVVMKHAVHPRSGHHAQ
jgi:hypothetical protein